MPARRGKIVDLLRRRIVEGDFPAGQPIPARAGLAEQLNCGPATLQQALGELEREGFVRTIPRQGTFVSDAPPHLSNYALVFNSSPQFGRTWPEQYFYTALASVVDQVSGREGQQVHVYTGVDEPEHRDTLDQLLDDARNRRLAGIILAHPWMTDICEQAGVPIVSFYGELDRPDIIGVNMDQRVMHRRMLEELKAQGRKRVAWIFTSEAHVALLESVQRDAAEIGLETQPGWITCLDRHNRHWAYHAVQNVLDDSSPNRRPDALIIGEDSLTDAVAGALVRSSVRVPKDLAVYAHANFPEGTQSPLAIRYFGWDMRHVLRNCLQLIDRAIAGEQLPRVTSIDPVSDAVAGLPVPTHAI